MLSSSLNTILQNRLRYLPEITGKAISSVDWPTKVIDIGRKYGLHIDDIEELQMVVLKSMTGLLPPADFETNLINATAASPATAEQMIGDMNDQIFQPIHEFVMNNGKQPDSLTSTGIVIEPETHIPDAPYPSNKNPLHDSGEGGRQSRPGEVVTGPAELEIPASPKPMTKPQVKGNFSSFFVDAPTGGSMLK